MPLPESLPGLPEDYTSKFFSGDVVTKLLDSTYRAKVLRCWAEEEGDLPPLPPGHVRHPLDRNLLRGEVGIKEMGNGALHITPESSLVLYQREFLRGDIVKRSLTRIESAVVVDTDSEVILQDVVTKQRVKKWVPLKKVKNSLIVEARDRVVYDHWLGSVDEVLEEGRVESSNRPPYKMVEMGGVLDPGRTVGELIPRNVFDAVDLHYPQASPTDRVVEVKPVLIAITWHAINQKLSIAEQDQHPEPKRLWEHSELKDLIHFDSTMIRPPMVGYSVMFADDANVDDYGDQPAPPPDPSRARQIFEIIEARTKLTLRWQDGTETKDWAHELVPHHNIDDYEMWPGEHLVWRGDNGERRPALIRRFDPHQRLADLTFADTGEQQTVSVLELETSAQGRHYGVQLGQQVLLCDDNQTPSPEVPILGHFATPMESMIWRSELAERAEEIVRNLDVPTISSTTGDTFSKDCSQIDWYGEIENLYLDGNVGVLLANGERVKVPLKRLQLLGDQGHMDDMMGPTEEEAVWAEEMGMAFDMELGSEASWETMSGGGNEMTWEDDQGQHEFYQELEGVPVEMDIDEDEQERRDVEEIDPLVEPSSPVSGTASSSGQHDAMSESWPEAGPSSPRHADNLTVTEYDSGTEPAMDGAWERFVMLEEAPEDHHFYGQLSNQAGSRAYHSRLAKEHRALASSLPDNILVRTYENRTDLLRCLIIGPEGTPYAGAPFVFDVYLNPMKFPHEPPSVYFHSHTFGKGRCNPNLYEEGKVCLSILGTWSGEQSESWNPAKSSLLQVFVSISGLVLVKSPYHCEPAFAKLEGTKEGRINSRLYSEKAYVLSRSFVRTALERPPSGLEVELRYLYLTRGRLRAVIQHARRLIEKGEEQAASNGGKSGEELQDENEEMWNADAMGSLTMGAILTLKRTITALEKIQQEQSQS